MHAKVEFGVCTERYLKCKSRVICTHIEETGLIKWYISQKTRTKVKSKFAVKINTGGQTFGVAN